MTTTVSGSYPAVNSDSDATINGLTVGKGTGNFATNTALGFETLKANTTGEENVAVGYRALDANTTGTNSIAMGRNALGSNTTGSSNVAIGDSALVSNTTASSNAAFGSDALNANTTGANNVAVGRSALQANTTASNNTAVGYQSLYSNTTGFQNTSLGEKAGYSNTTESYSTYIGYGSGESTTGAQNTFVGSNAGNSITSGAKNSILGRYNGNQGSLDIRTASNRIVLSDGDGNPRQYINNNGQVAWGTSSIDGYLTLTWAGQTYVGFVMNNTDAFGTSANIRFKNNGTLVGEIASSTTATNYVTSSDYRLKENVVPMTGALAKVAQLKPVTYKWKSNGSDGQGFIAHELQEVAPYAVSGKKDGEQMQGVDYGKITPLLTAALQEALAKIESLEARLAVLESK